MANSSGVKIIAQNRKARHDYFIEDVVEAGIALIGTEVKSLRQGRASLSDAYAEVVGGEVFLRNAHIAQYEPASRFNHDPVRPRRLLLHKRDPSSASKVAERGYTPLSLYFRTERPSRTRPGKGRKAYNKREAIRERDIRRDIDRKMRERQKE